MSAVPYTMGALLVGTLPLAHQGARWGFAHAKTFKKSPVKAAATAAPLVLSWSVGAMTAMIAGGLVGWAKDVVIWGAGWLGDAVLVWGVGSRRGAAPGGTEVPLTPGGLFMACLVLATYVGSRKGNKWLFLSGLLMALSAGVARFAAVPIASSVNLAGFWWTGA